MQAVTFLQRDAEKTLDGCVRCDVAISGSFPDTCAGHVKIDVDMDWTFIPSSEEEEDFTVPRAPPFSHSTCSNDVGVGKASKKVRNQRLSKEEAVWLKLEKDIDIRMRLAIDRDARAST